MKLSASSDMKGMNNLLLEYLSAILWKLNYLFISLSFYFIHSYSGSFRKLKSKVQTFILGLRVDFFTPLSLQEHQQEKYTRRKLL